MTSALDIAALCNKDADQLPADPEPPSPSEVSADPPPTVAAAANPHASAPHTPTLSTKLNGVTFEVVLGDLTDEQTDAIVNPTDDQLMLEGNLYKAIESKGGSVITAECRLYGCIPVGGTVVTNGGALSCRHVVHVVAPDDLQECERAVRAVIQAAVANNFKSISFPPIVTSEGLPLDQMAGCIVNTLADADNQTNTGSLNLVRLVGFSAQEEVAFGAELTHAMWGKRKAQTVSHSTLAIESSTNGIVINGVFIEILQGDITNESTDAIVNPSDKGLMLTGDLSKALIAKGGASIEDECKVIGKLNYIAITSAGSLHCRHVIHILAPTNISECQQVLRALISTIATKRFGSVSISPIGVSLGIPLQQVANCITDEVASAACGKTFEVLHHLRLVGFKQKEKDAFERALKLFTVKTFALTAIKSVNVNLPVTWAPMVTNQNWSQVPMEHSDADYAEALQLFTLSGKTPQNIYRIQNPTLYVQYQLEKTDMEEFAGSIERRLYHGTEEFIVPKICAKGFDRSYCGKNAVSYGRGSYFARDMSYSAHDTYSKPNPVTGQKYVLVSLISNE